ncbi:LOW QUALITY PROTEIN: trichoplein keratin filament-binding protein-like [Lampetra planeri]
MALPTLSTYMPSRDRSLAGRMARQREQEARLRQQWETHAQYFREQGVRSQRQAVWSSQHCYQRSMSAYHHQKEMEEKRAHLEKRRTRLRIMLEDEQKRLEAELKKVVSGKSTPAAQLEQKTETVLSAREEKHKELAQDLREHWKNSELQQVSSEFSKDVVSQCQEQTAEEEQQEAAEQQKTRDFENEQEQKTAEQHQKADELCKQMEELKLWEEEATRLKKAHKALVVQQWELEKLEEDRRNVEERRKRTEMGHFLIRQYRAQLKRRARQVQEELEADCKILADLLKGEHEDRRTETVRGERVVADAAWMKQVIEEQLQLEREREAEFDNVHREEAQRVWEKREAQWEKERRARERLMQEVLLGRQQQLELEMQKNCEAQEESLRRREELIQELELERESRRQEESHSRPSSISLDMSCLCD